MRPKSMFFRHGSRSIEFCGVATLAGMFLSCFSLLPAQQSQRAAAQAVAGWKAYEEGRLQDAKPLLEQAVRLAPANADYQAALAEVESKSGQEDAAIQHFERAIVLKPLDSEFRLNLAQLLQKKGNDQEALRFLQTAHPNSDLADLWRFTRGFSLFRLGRFGPAQEEFKPLLEKPQFKASASFFLGNIAYSQGQFEEAEPYLAAAVDLGNVEGNRAFNIYAYDYGMALFRLRKFAEADRQFRVSIAQYDKDPMPWMFLGRCEEEMGNYSEAIAMLETSIKTDPTFQLSYYELARLQQRHGDPSRAAELFEKIGEMKKEEIRKEEERATRLKTTSEAR